MSCLGMLDASRRADSSASSRPRADICIHPRLHRQAPQRSENDMNRRLTLLASALLLVTSQAFAAHHEVATVEVVQVPVYISVNGHAVTDLTKDDFEIYVNGKR